MSLAGRFLTTVPPGRSLLLFFKKNKLIFPSRITTRAPKLSEIFSSVYEDGSETVGLCCHSAGKIEGGNSN